MKVQKNMMISSPLLERDYEPIVKEFSDYLQREIKPERT